jgi:uncharacterized protein with PQ loop repeat
VLIRRMQNQTLIDSTIVPNHTGELKRLIDFRIHFEIVLVSFEKKLQKSLSGGRRIIQTSAINSTRKTFMLRKALLPRNIFYKQRRSAPIRNTIRKIIFVPNCDLSLLSRASSSIKRVETNVGSPVLSAFPLMLTAGQTSTPWYFSISATGAAAKMLAALPPVFFLGMQLAPLRDVIAFFKTKSVGAIMPLPYFTLFTNCVIWTGYGLLMNDLTLIAANGIGVVLAGFYSLAYSKFAPFSMTKYFVGSAAYLSLPLIAYYALPADQLAPALG